jgi:hypothetical protein
LKGFSNSEESVIEPEEEDLPISHFLSPPNNLIEKKTIHELEVRTVHKLNFE